MQSQLDFIGVAQLCFWRVFAATSNMRQGVQRNSLRTLDPERKYLFFSTRFMVERVRRMRGWDRAAWGGHRPDSEESGKKKMTLFAGCPMENCPGNFPLKRKTWELRSPIAHGGRPVVFGNPG